MQLQTSVKKGEKISFDFCNIFNRSKILPYWSVLVDNLILSTWYAVFSNKSGCFTKCLMWLTLEQTNYKEYDSLLNILLDQRYSPCLQTATPATAFNQKNIYFHPWCEACTSVKLTAYLFLWPATFHNFSWNLRQVSHWEQCLEEPEVACQRVIYGYWATEYHYTRFASFLH